MPPPRTTGATNDEAASSAPSQSEELVSLCYQSQGRPGLTSPEVEALVDRARQRNAEQQVTGELLFEPRQRRFLQWLEGPRTAVERLWSSIQKDSRHHHLELLRAGRAPARRFSDWGLKLQAGDARDEQLPQLTSVLLNTVDHELLRPLVQAFEGEELRRRGHDLASLLLAHDNTAAERFIDSEYARCGSLLDLYADLLEPAARDLGDRWSLDECLEVDLTLALGQLSAKAHRLACDLPAQAPCGCSMVLCTPPGETHLLGSSLLGELMWLQGWDVELKTRNESPTANRLSPEMLVVCLSPAFKRGLRDGWDDLMHLPGMNGRRGVYGRLDEADGVRWTQAGADFAESSLREAYRRCCAMQND